MKIEMFEQLLEMLRQVKQSYHRDPMGSLRRVVPTIEERVSLNSALSRQTIAGRWTKDIGLASKSELRELLTAWLKDGYPGPLYGVIRGNLHIPPALDQELRDLLGMDRDSQIKTQPKSSLDDSFSEELSGTLHLAPQERGAIAIHAGKLGVSAWQFVELLVRREARKALARYDDVVDVDEIIEESSYPLQGAPFSYTDPTEPVGVEDWEALK